MFERISSEDSFAVQDLCTCKMQGALTYLEAGGHTFPRILEDVA